MSAQQYLREVKRALEYTGSLAEFTLKGEQPFSIVVGPRWRREEPQTGVMSQQLDKITVCSLHWPEGMREPAKGDRVRVQNRNFSIDESHRLEFGDLHIGWRLQVLG